MLKTKTKKSVQSLTLSQVVKIVESIDLKQLPMDEKNHELLLISPYLIKWKN